MLYILFYFLYFPQYCAHISTCYTREEPVNSIRDGFFELLDVFSKRNNGNYPKHIIVYRDGVADNQFNEGELYLAWNDRTQCTTKFQFSLNPTNYSKHTQQFHVGSAR